MPEWKQEILKRLEGLNLAPEREAAIAEELSQHLEDRYRELLAGGNSKEESRRRAGEELSDEELRARLGRAEYGMPQERLEPGSSAGRNFLASIGQDLRFGARVLRGNPAFSILTILCLTLGIGSNAIVFSWIEGIMFRPYPLVRHQERMAAIVGTQRGTNEHQGMSWPDFQDLARDSKLVEAFIAEKIGGARLGLGDHSEYAVGSMVSANYFTALGVHPMLGRGFEPGEDAGRNAHPVTVISYQSWKNRFGGDPGVIGRTEMLDGVQYTVVGVAPQGFYGTFVGYQFQFWVPASMQDALENDGYQLENRGARWIEGFVMLKPGVSIGAAQQELSGIATRLENTYPSTNRGHGIRLFPLWQTPFNGTATFGPMLGIALVVVVLVLFIACANVGNLMLVRSLARRREMTVRLALGAMRGRLLRQLLTEGLILSALSVAGAMIVAIWSRNLLARLIPPRSVPVYLPGELDWRVFALIAAVGLFASLPFALAPAAESRDLDLANPLKAESSGVVGGRGKTRLRSMLVVAQVSLSFLLLVGAGLVLKSLARIRASSPGFSTENVLTAFMNLSAAGYDAPRARNFEDELLSRVRALPGVESAAFARVLPFTYPEYSSAPIAVEGYQLSSDQQLTIRYDEISPGFFSTMGIPLLSGRDFTPADDEHAARVAIVNEAMASQFWPGADPVGRRFQSNGQWLRIVGVAKLAKYRNFPEPAQPFFYAPLRQNPSSQVELTVRTSGRAQSSAPDIARAIHGFDANLPLYSLLTMRELVDRMSAPQRIAVTLLMVFSGLALLLAAVGLYGVMSYAVSGSTREFGLRMAMGASPADLVRLIMSRGMALVALGLILGVAGAITSTRLLGYLLYDVSPRDPLAFALAFAVMALVTTAACLIPALRAARINPVRALQSQ